MKKKDLFPNYEPKRAPDTIYNYLRNPKTEIFNMFSGIGEPTIEKLKNILELFKKYEKEAKRNLGRFENERIYLGAELKQYIPSKE